MFDKVLSAPLHWSSILTMGNFNHERASSIRIFRTQSNIYDGAFLQKQLTTFSRLFSKKVCIVDIWLGFTYVSVQRVGQFGFGYFKRKDFFIPGMVFKNF